MFDGKVSANPVPVGTNGRGAISQRRAVSRPPLVPMPCHLRDEPCCTTVARARHLVDAAQRQPMPVATRGLTARNDARFVRWRSCCTSPAARTFVRAAECNSASARNGAGHRGMTRPMWPGAAPRQWRTCGTKPRGIACTTRSRRLALRDGWRRGAGRVDRTAVSGSRTTPRRGCRRRVRTTWRDGRRISRRQEKRRTAADRIAVCSQKREVALRRPRNPDHDLRRRSKRRMRR